MPETLAAGNVDLARQPLKGYLGSVRVVAEPTRMLLYSERNAVEAMLARAAGGGNMASINGSGGVLCTNSTAVVCFPNIDRRKIRRQDILRIPAIVNGNSTRW